ncbi:MAG TPA: nuclear transport factor 2 family protein, partial [Microvirga sp.]|nr:nuclear transport factor 2 family protein [Microvirga sp.]
AIVDATMTKKHLIGLEQAYSKALINKDRAFLESYYAPDFRGGNWMGFWTKSTMLKAVLDDRYSVQSMDLSNLQVRAVGTIGIVQGVSTEVTRVNGKDTSGRWSFTDVFEWRDGRWVTIASHTSELKPDTAK